MCAPVAASLTTLCTCVEIALAASYECHMGANCASAVISIPSLRAGKPELFICSRCGGYLCRFVHCVYWRDFHKCMLQSRTIVRILRTCGCTQLALTKHCFLHRKIQPLCVRSSGVHRGCVRQRAQCCMEGMCVCVVVEEVPRGVASVRKVSLWFIWWTQVLDDEKSLLFIYGVLLH